jgi:hypothetical protein
MSPLSVPASSVIYISADIIVPSSVTDPKSLPLSAAILPTDYGNPQSADWKTAGVQWDPDAAKPSTGQALAGPGTAFDFSSARGTYKYRFKVTSDPEAPDLISGFITFT